MFIDTFRELCAEKGISLSRALLDLDMSKASISRWNKGGEPTNSSKRKIADYFGITVQELNGQKEKPTSQEDVSLSEADKELMSVFKQLNADQKRIILSVAESWITE